MVFALKPRLIWLDGDIDAFEITGAALVKQADVAMPAPCNVGGNVNFVAAAASRRHRGTPEAPAARPTAVISNDGEGAGSDSDDGADVDTKLTKWLGEILADHGVDDGDASELMQDLRDVDVLDVAIEDDHVGAAVASASAARVREPKALMFDWHRHLALLNLEDNMWSHLQMSVAPCPPPIPHGSAKNEDESCTTKNKSPSK